jgi:hypothetical protein
VFSVTEKTPTPLESAALVGNVAAPSLLVIATVPV